MRPAFSSTRQAALFGLLILAILLLPLLLRKSLLPGREKLYAAASWGDGAFPYIHDQIFQESGDIDIAFMGCSTIFWGIDTPYVQARLSEKLGREAAVRTIGWNRPGYDPFYFISRDLLEHRKVRMIVFCDLSRGATNTAHLNASHWFRFGEDAPDLAGVPLQSEISFYASAALGAPRNLLSLLRPDQSVIWSNQISWAQFVNIPNPALRLGSLAVSKRYDGPFSEFAPPKPADPAAALTYSAGNKEAFQFSDAALPELQTAMMRKIGVLARKHGVKLVCLHMTGEEERRSTVIKERSFWPDTFQSEVSMVGVPGGSLFAGLSDQEVRKLFYDYQHFNANGQKYFTPAITPALMQLYESETRP